MFAPSTIETLLTVISDGGCDEGLLAAGRGPEGKTANSDHPRFPTVARVWNYPRATQSPVLPATLGYFALVQPALQVVYIFCPASTGMRQQRC